MIKPLLVDKYLFKQVFLSTLVCIFLFIVVWISPEILFKIIKRVLSGDYSVLMGMKLLFLELPKILGKALPVGLLLGCLFTFDKLSKDFELTILRGVGFSFWRILCAPIVLSIFVTFLCFIVYDKLIPYSTEKLNQVKNEKHNSHFVYTLKDDQNKLSQVVIVSNYNEDSVNDLMVLNFNKSDSANENTSALNSIISSKSAKFEGNYWSLLENKKYNINIAGIFENIEDIDRIEILNGEKSVVMDALMRFSLKKEREMTNNEIFRFTRLLKKEQLMDEYNFTMNKYLQRYFHPLICILFTILGCLLGFSQPREQRLVGFTIAIGVVFLYYITLPFLDMLAEKMIASPYLTASIQPILITICIFIFKKAKDL